MTAMAEANYNTIQDQIFAAAKACGRNPDHINLIAVSKRKPVEAIMPCILAGARHLGENYIQEAVGKIDIIGRNTVTWHFIGHLQSNKTFLAVQYFDYIHTVDSLKLARAINKQAKKIDKIQNILIQVNISKETTKSGVLPENAMELVQAAAELDHVCLTGLMCMPPYFDDPENVRTYFRHLARLKEDIHLPDKTPPSLEHLSMGMSHDFKVAIQEGATMVRVGTSIFGERL